MCNNTLLREENEKLCKDLQNLKQKLRLLVNSQNLMEINYQKVRSENNKLKDFYVSSTSKNTKNYELSKSFCQGNTFAFHQNHYEEKNFNNNNISMDSSVDPEKKTWKNYIKEMDKQLYGMRSTKKSSMGQILKRKNSE